MSLRDRIVIVTGGTSDIGEGIASVFSKKGATVVIADVDRNVAEQTAADLPGETMAIETEVTGPAETEALAETVTEEYGQVNILCANAGIFPSVSLEDSTVEDWDEVFDINAKGVFLTTKACLPYMREQGRIVITSSITGSMVGHPGWTHYSATEAGVLASLAGPSIVLAYKMLCASGYEQEEFRAKSPLFDIVEPLIDEIQGGVLAELSG